MKTSVLVAIGLAVFAGSAHAGPVDVSADIIWDDNDAKDKCPNLCMAKSLYWTGSWHKVGWTDRPMCICNSNRPPPPPRVSTPWPPQGQMAPPPAATPWPPHQNAGPPPTQIQLPGGTVIRYDFTDFHRAGDIRNFGSPSFEHCASVCLASPECGAVTYAFNQRRCYMKSGPGNARSAPASTSAVVMTRDGQ